MAGLAVEASCKPTLLLESPHHLTPFSHVSTSSGL